MNIWIDICHTPQYNFYKHFILRLLADGHHVYVTILDRGRTPQIIKHEIGDLQGVELFVIGKHRLHKLSAIIEANGIRLIQLYRWAHSKSIDVIFSNCMAAMIVGRILAIPRYSFDDDPQTIDFMPKKWCSLESNYCLYDDPDTVAAGAPVKVLKVLKEWAYLSPKVFSPDVNALNRYDVRPKQYLFLREVSVGTVNYAGQANGAILSIKHLIPSDKRVLFSLEDKSRRNEYPKDWILLEEPIKDIHSLMYYSAGLISSGDSMAREAALLGVPAYYLGIRHSMPANKAANKVADLQNELSMPIEKWIDSLSFDANQAEEQQIALRQRIESEFIDINSYMMELVEKQKKK